MDKQAELDLEEYGLYVGMRVQHIRDASWVGVVVDIDRNLQHPTTCQVRWDDTGNVDVQSTNKLKQAP